jgi:hypothetical protein
MGSVETVEMVEHPVLAPVAGTGLIDELLFGFHDRFTPSTSPGLVEVPQVFPHFRKRPGEVGFHRAHVQTEQSGNFIEAQVLEMAQRKDGPLALREPFHRRLEPRADLLRVEFVLGIGPFEGAMARITSSSSWFGRFRQNCQRRDRNLSRQVLTAIRVTQRVRSSISPSCFSNARWAFRKTSWVAVSASSGSPSIRRQSKKTLRCWEAIQPGKSDRAAATGPVATSCSAIAPILPFMTALRRGDYAGCAVFDILRAK